MPELDEIILLEEDGLIVVNKPCGLPTAGDTLEQEGSLQYELMQRYRRMIWAVHQLDKPTTGLNLFVRRKALVQQWTDHLAHGHKDYLAICHGRVAHDHFFIDEPIAYSRALKRRHVDTNGKRARSEVFALSRSINFSLLRIRLHTGRTHQIRVHMAHRGHPLVGEGLYRDVPCALSARHMLHAWKISAHHLSLTAPPPRDFLTAARDLSLELPT